MVSFSEDYIINEQLGLRVCFYELAVDWGQSTLYKYWKTWF